MPDDSLVPNNPELPLLLYRGVMRSSDERTEAACEHLFEGNFWGGCWRNGIFDRHHYHPDAHEVLGITGGAAVVQFGGPSGPTMNVTAGDVVVIPAGVGHCRKSPPAGLRVVGAYPKGASYQTYWAGQEDRARAADMVSCVARPSHDPVYGAAGPLIALWS